MFNYRFRVVIVLGLIWPMSAAAIGRAADLTVAFDDAADAVCKAADVTFVGVLQRWDADGNARKLPDPKAKIDAPAVDASATQADANHWVFRNLAPGVYDLVVLGRNRLRIEGFRYAPVREFDPFFPPTAKVEDEEAREFIVDDIKQAPHYENVVEPLYLGGDAQTIRVLVMLLRDQKTSYEADFPGAATLRHEIWQYTLRYGAWRKEKRTKVLDRVLLHRDELHKWTWLWDPQLGNISVGDSPVAASCRLPNTTHDKPLKGLYPR